MAARRAKKQFCIHGHDTFKCGRDKSNGTCKDCGKVRNANKPKNPKVKQQFCKRGHDTFLPGGRNKWGNCQKCKDDYNAKLRKGRPPKQFCKYGHDTFVCGRTKNHYCNDCATLRHKAYVEKHKKRMQKYEREYKVKHKARIKKQKRKWREDNKEVIKIWTKNYYLEHEEKIKQQRIQRDKENSKELLRRTRVYRKNHPEKVKLWELRHHKKRGLRLPQWGQDGMDEFYKNMPKDMSEDHIIPLCGKKVSGLHVRWNLQYMPLWDNQKKSNKVNLIIVSEDYGKLLEKLGLK